MGMDLIGAGLSYNWTGWRSLEARLRSWGVDVQELRFSNDGDPISKETCAAIANAIEAHLDELTRSEREWLEPDIENWKNCNGCLQY